MASPNPILTNLAAVLGPGGLVTDADILKRIDLTGRWKQQIRKRHFLWPAQRPRHKCLR
jgi:hypothetical protein